jgi:hypothetical protein
MSEYLQVGVRPNILTQLGQGIADIGLETINATILWVKKAPGLSGTREPQDRDPFGLGEVGSYRDENR